MKVLAVLLLIAGFVLLAFTVLLYFFGFIMSFDAPGSMHDGKAWLFRFAMFLPILALLGALIVSLHAFATKRYKRSVFIGLAYCVVAVGIMAAVSIQSFRSINEFNAKLAQEEADALLYPKEKYLRQIRTQADTIFVFPNRRIHYRVSTAPGPPMSGPMGDLNKTRDTIIYLREPHNKVEIHELDQFIDAYGRKLTDVYAVR